MAYDLATYETVKERKKRFYADHPDGRIIAAEHSTNLLEYSFFVATLYLCKEDQEKGLPKSTGQALEIRDMEKQVSKQGKEYESVNYTSWVENCEESAIGRALDNAGYSGNNKCSREEMEKVERMKKQNEAAAKLKVLPENIKEGFKLLGYQANVVWQVCNDFSWDNDKIFAELNKRLDRQVSA
jgi:hypothetical protein